MITPRVTRLFRAPGLRELQTTIVSVLPRGWSARTTAVVLPTRSAAESLRCTIEQAALEGPASQPPARQSGDGLGDVQSGIDDPQDSVVWLPDLLTRGDLYLRLHTSLDDAPPLLTEFEREVLLRLAAADARREGAEAPFRLRPGLIGAILGFYDELRRRGGSIDSFDRLVRARLEPGSEVDRGAARLLEQTRFLAATFSAFERRVSSSGRIDEHALRAMLLSTTVPMPYRHVIVCVADQAADSRGLWPADFDLLARLSGLERLDIIATERVLAAGFHRRLHEALPGLAEERLTTEAARPRLLVPECRTLDSSSRYFVCRDREEELVEAGRWLKARARTSRAAGQMVVLDRTAIVFQRPLPYLYLARHVLGSCNVPYQAVDALPLASEPFAAAVDLIFTVLSEEATRSSVVELLSSPHWTFADPATPDHPIERHEVAALDRVLRDSKYLGGWDRLRELAAKGIPHRDSAPRSGGARNIDGWQQAGAALAAAVTAVSELEGIAAAATASEQLERLRMFVVGHERTSSESVSERDRHMRARAAVLGALGLLREAHARYDDRPLPVGELLGTIRRWIEEQTFAPRTGLDGVLLLDVPAAAFADVDAIRLVGLVESDWPERTCSSIFYPASVLRDLGWPSESDRLAAARARFQDLLFLPWRHVSVSSFTLEDDAIVPPSPFLDDLVTAGLAIEQFESPATTRIFAHEALDVGPVASDGISATARDWLQLRLARTSSLDLRYRGSVDRRAADVYAVSRVERYLACPFKYFAGHVLQLEEERDEESGLTPQERGQLLHGVFEAFFTAWRERGGTTITADTLDEAVRLFAEVAESHLEALPEADRALERTYLLGSAASPGLAERAFAFEIEHGISVVERYIEYPFDGTYSFEGTQGPRDIRVRGKVDRIDLLDDGSFRVVDYKLGRAPKPGRALQLPIYGVCAQQQLHGYRGRTWSLARAGYVAFREKNPFVELGGRNENLDEALRDGQHRFVDAVERIEAGEFPVTPDEPWTCTRCGFPHVCRKDYVGDE